MCFAPAKVQVMPLCFQSVVLRSWLRRFISAQHVGAVATVRLLISLIPLQRRHARHLDVSELAVVSPSLIVIYTLVALGRRLPSVDAHHHRIGDLLLALILQSRPERIDHLLDLVQRDPSLPIHKMGSHPPPHSHCPAWRAGQDRSRPGSLYGLGAVAVISVSRTRLPPCWALCTAATVIAIVPRWSRPLHSGSRRGARYGACGSRTRARRPR